MTFYHGFSQRADCRTAFNQLCCHKTPDHRNLIEDMDDEIEDLGERELRQDKNLKDPEQEECSATMEFG